MYQQANPYKEIEREIITGNLERALIRLIEFSDKLIAEPRIVSSVFGSRKLDGFCQTIGAKALESFAPNIDRVEDLNSKIVIVATEVYRSGGHTAVIKDLITAYKNMGVPVLVIIVDTFQTANHVEIVSALKDTQIIFAPKHIGLLERVVWLQKQILAERPERTYLFNHMNDPVSVAAFQPELPTNSAYFHHSDHRFALGVFLSHLQHIDFRELGLENCRYNLGIENNWLLPLMNDDISNSSGHREFLSSGSLRTCTTGSYKFDAPYAYSLSESVLPDIVSSTGGTHIHIGPLSERNEYVIRDKLDERKIPQERFILIEVVKSLWSSLIDFEVDVYIDSFPIGGCRSVIEAMGAGIPIVVHQSYKSRLLSNKDLVYKEAFCWREPNELYRHFAKLDKYQLLEQSRFSRLHYELKHTPSVFDKILRQFSSQVSPPPVPRLTADYLQDECLEFFDYNRDLQDKLTTEKPARSKHYINTELLMSTLETLIPSTVKEGIDKEELSNMLFRNSTEASGRRKSNLSEALLNAARIAYPREAYTTSDRETVSEFLFRFSTGRSETNMEILVPEALQVNSEPSLVNREDLK